MRSLVALLVVAVFAAAAPVPKKVKAKLPDYYPLADGNEWVYVIGMLEVSGTFTLKGTEKVKMPAGEYDAVRVCGSGWKIAGMDTAIDTWLADGVGIVKIQTTLGGNASTPLELKKYTPGKAK